MKRISLIKNKKHAIYVKKKFCMDKDVENYKN